VWRRDAAGCFLFDLDESLQGVTFVQSAIALLIVGTVIATLGAAAIIVYAFRRRAHERFLLWFGLFSILYGTILVVRNSVFRLGFGQPDEVWISVERLLSLATIIPGLLLFEEFYGPGWRSSIRWLLGVYCALSAVAIGSMVFPHPFRIAMPPGAVLVIMVPAMLAIGRLAGYRPPNVPDSGVLFTGLIVFFVAFSIDRVLHTELKNWHTGLEPYGFLVLVICLWYVISQSVIADERRLASLTDEMRAAEKIQEAILPRTVPSVENVQIAARYAPMTSVAGDFYDFPTVCPNGVSVLIADVMGHGVPAALVASMVKVAVSNGLKASRDPSNIIAGLNATLCDAVHEQYATAVYLYLDAANRVGRYASAAHPPGLVWRRGRQTLERMDESGLLLGVRPNERYTTCEVSFDVGDRLLLYSDGLVEAENAEGESFGDAALPNFIQKKQSLGAEQFVDLLLENVLAWSRSGSTKAQEDDITIVVMDIKDGRSRR
jgi:sigma-B regulation protein RsbU (phosphoserine phosphatase)